MSVYYRYALRARGFGIEHWFVHRGDETPWHRHVKGYGHDVECLKGGIAIVYDIGGDVSEHILNAGHEPQRFDCTAMHLLVAFENDTLVFNRLDVRPDDYLVRLRDQGDWQCL